MRTFLIVVAVLSIAADWLQYQGPNRDNTSPETGLARAWPKDGPKVVWKKDAGSGWAGPAVAAEIAILFYRVGDDEVVECVDAATGKEKWKQTYRARYVDDFSKDNGPRSTPAIVGDKVFTLGADGDLSAFDLEKGKRHWQRNINKDYNVQKGYFGVGTSPLVVAGTLIIHVGGKEAGVVAFDPANGKEIWKAAEAGVNSWRPVVA